jgi:hypothetical protein
MSLWDRIKSWKTQNAQQLVYGRIPAERTDVAAGPAIAAYQGYVRVFLADMFLTQSRAWFTAQYPCVTASVRLDLDGRPGATLSYVARPPQGVLSPSVRLNYPITDLLPFSGNLVEIEAALLSLAGDRYLDAALGALESLTSLVSGPLGQAIAIAAKVASGIEKLVDEGDGKVHLGLHDSFGSAGGHNPLQSGYLAVALATPAQLPPASLGVTQNRLYVQAADGSWSPLQGVDYMLFFVEARTERDNWRLPSIQHSLDQALEALVLDDGARAEAYKKAAIVAALTCKELTPLDRRRAAQAVKEELIAAAGAGHGLVGDGASGLEAIVKRRAASIDRALAGDLPTEAEILG